MYPTMTNFYDVPVGGNLIPAPSFTANGIESTGSWQIWSMVDRFDGPYRPRLMSTVFVAERPRMKEPV